MKFKMLIKLILFVIIANLANISLSLGSNLAHEILAELKKSPVQRIFVGKTAGLGHQSHSLLIARRLRSLGYKGKIEIIYDSEAIQKIETLFPIKIEQDITIDDENNMVFINKRSIARRPNGALVKGHNYEIIHLGFCLSGGLDHKVNDEFMPRLYTYNCDAMIALNPQGWDRPSFVEILQTKEFVDLKKITDLSIHPTDYLFIKETINQDLVNWLRDINQSTTVLPFYAHKNHKILLLQRLINSLIKAYPGRTFVIPIFNRLNEEDLKLICEGCDDKNLNWIKPYDQPLPGKVNLVAIDHVNPATFKEIFSRRKFPIVFVSGRNSIAEALFSGQPFIEAQEHFDRWFFTRNSNFLNYRFYLSLIMRALFYKLNFEFQASNFNFDTDTFARLLKYYLDFHSGRESVHLNFANIFNVNKDKLLEGLKLSFDFLKSQALIPVNNLTSTKPELTKTHATCSLYLR